MTFKIQVRSDTSTALSSVVLDVGELAYYTNTKSTYIGDGSTLGGVALSGGGAGTLTSIAASSTCGLSFTGSPVTTSGTFILAGTLNIAHGGTGQTTANASLNALLPDQTGASGYVLTSDGANTSWAALAAASGASGLTSVGVSAGTTGLSVTGSPVTTSGTMTLGGTLSLTNGGTGQTTATSAFNALQPMTTLGDTLYGGAAGAGTRLAGNTSTTKNFLSQTGTGSASVAPVWGTVSKTDVGLANVENTALSTWPGTTNINTLGTVATGTWHGSAIGIVYGGTGQATATAATNALLPSQTSASGFLLTSNGVETSWITPPYIGTVTSIAASSTCGLTFSGSPVTTSGTFVLAGTLAIANGGTGQTTATAAVNALLPTQSTATTNLFLQSNGTNVSWSAPAGSGTVTSIAATASVSGLSFTGSPISTSGTLTLTGTLAIAGGGTGQTTATSATNALLPTQTSNSGKFLTTDGSVTSWGNPAGSGTITSVAATGGTTGLTFTGSPITTSGTLTVTGTLALGAGGTGQATATAAANALLPTQTSNSGKYLTTDGVSVVSWATVNAYPRQLGYAGIF